jgi:phosphohistidine phosphatase
MTATAARTLVLVRHAKSAWPDVPDHDRPLAARGRRDAPAAGRWLRDHGWVPDRVLCSTARRARETWELVANGLEITPLVSFEPAIYQATSAGLLHVIRRVPPPTLALLVIGHDPSIQELAVTLTGSGDEPGGRPDAGADRMAVKFPTAAIAILTFAGSWKGLGPGRARLARFLTPREIRTPN